MSISITVSGDGSSQVIQSSSEGESITVSSTDGRQITVTPSDSPTTIVSETPGVASDLTTAFAPALASQSNDLTNFQLKLKAVTGVLNARLDDISGATGILNTQVTGNTADITGIELAHGSFTTRISGISGQVNTVSGLTLATSAAISSNIDNTSNIVLLTNATGILNTQVTGLTGTTGSFAVTGSDVTFKNLTVSGNILPENTGASIGSPSGRFKDLHLSENSIFLGDSKISFSGGASGGLTITGSGLLTTGGQPKVIKLLGEDDEGRIAVQSSLEVGRNIFLGDEVNDAKIKMQGPGPVNYSFVTHANGFRLTDGDGGGGVLINVPHSFYDSDGTRRTMTLTDTSVQGQFFTSSGVHHSADPDTAFLFPDSNTTSILTSGVERLRVNKSGKLGIGSGFRFQAVQPSRLVHIKTHTTDDDGQHPLRVEGASSSILELKAGDNTSLVGIDFSDNAAPHPGSIVYNHSNNSMAFDTNDATRMTISDSGHVIITGDLTVASGITIGTGTVLTSGETQTNIDTAVANLVDSAPATLNTLNELAAALGDDANFSTTTATSLGNLSTATGNLSTATGNLNTRVNSNDSDISTLNTATGALSTATGLLSAATGVLQGVTGSFAQTGSGNFGLLSVTGNISLGGNIIDTADGDILQFGANDLIAGGKHIQAGFSVGVRGNRGDTKGMDQGSTANDLGIFCNSIEALSIQNDGDVIVNTGNLGIGTTSPDTQLHIKSAGDVSLKLEADTDNTNESHNPLMQFIQDGGLISANVGFNGNTNTDFTNAIDNAFYIENTSSAAGFGAIQFASNNEAKLTILSGGNVGIGTSNPEALLDVSSNVAGKYLRVSRGTTNVDFDFSAGSTVISSTVKPLKFGPSDEQPLILQTSGSERARIDESGNFGIGTNSPRAKLHVNGDTIISGALTGTTTISAKGNINSINGSISASEGSFTLLNGQIQTASQSNITSLGTLTSAAIAGDLTVDTNTLFVNSTANSVGIGTTSITAGKQLDVNGDIKAVGIEASEVNVKDADGYFIENKQFAKFENNTLKLGDHDGESFTTDIFGNGGIPMIRITGDGSQAANTFLGIGTTAPQAKLHVAGNTIVSGGNLQIGSTPAYSQTRSIKLHDNGVQYAARVSLVGTNDNGGPGLEMVTDGSLSKRTIIRHEGEGSNDYGLAFFTTDNGTTSEKVRFDGNGGVGIGTTTPSAPLHVVGSGIITDDFAVDTNTLFVDASTNNVGIRTSTPRNLYALHVNDNFLVTNGNEEHLNIDTTAYVYKLGDISGGDNGSFFEVNSAQGTASVSQAAFGIGVTLPQASLHVNGTATVSGGLTTLGKTTLSSHAFVTETGSFTLGNTHKGATVLLQNSASINITVPAQVSGYVTTFIAETHNSVSFITGAGMSGLNSFNGASDIAGIYGQAQVIYKSAEYAFLGGNVV